MNAEFITWVRLPERTQEELITVERLTEIGVELWRLKHGFKVKDYLQAANLEKERKHQRQNNPAYWPQLLDVALERTTEMLEEINEIQFNKGSDRVVRALSPLRWLPALESLYLGMTELIDAEVLGKLPRLQKLHLSDGLMDDAAPIGQCRELLQLNLFLQHPWPKLDALGALQKLEEVTFYGNAFALEDVAEWPAMRRASIHGSGGPLRDLRRLPAMPSVEVLAVQPVFGLQGIERYPQVRNLTLSGPMEDLEPLAALSKLTFAELNGDGCRDVSPLASLPELRWLKFSAQRPRDYSSLAAAPRLHEVEVRGCTVNEMELSVLHAVLEPWAEECLAPEPRPLPDDRPLYYPMGNMGCGGWWPLPDPAGATWHGDPQLEVAEKRWFSRWVGSEVERFFSNRLEAGKARNIKASGSSREAHIELQEFEQVELLWELLPLLQGLLTRTRFRHAIYLSCHISVQEARGQERRSFREDEEKEESERWREEERKKQEQLDREHRFELLKADGAEIDPEDFAPPPLDEDRVLVPAGMESEKPREAWKPREFDLEEELPFDPDAWRFDEELEDWDFALFFSLLLTEEVCLVDDYHAKKAEYYLRRRPEKRQPRGGNGEAART